jgi:hypothetical protein
MVRIGWFCALLAAICFEGLARKLFPALPASALYFSKDIVLLCGATFGISAQARRTVAQLYGSFLIPAVIAFAVILLQLFNPEQASLPLGLLGVRSYCLWWAAALIVPSVLDSPRLVNVACQVMGITALVVSAVAAYQYNQPADAAINSYAWSNESEDVAVSVVHSTGRARVTSTFSYITGFNDFSILLTPFLLACGIAGQHARRRRLFLALAALAFFCGFMSGSRSAMVYALITIPLTIGLRAFLSRRIGPPLVAAIVLGGVAASYLAPEAVQGVIDRFQTDGDENAQRVVSALSAVPPLASFVYDYPIEGVGTGMTQTARQAFGVYYSRWPCESEPHRLLVELGIVGYAFVSLAKVGLGLGLFRLKELMKSKKMAGFSGFTLALAPLALSLRILTDHVMQALFFTVVGLLLAATLAHPEHSTEAS